MTLLNDVVKQQLVEWQRLAGGFPAATCAAHLRGFGAATG
jgi:hypothetical protein